MPTKKPQLDFSTIIANSVHDMKNSLGMLLNAIDELSDECEHGGCPTQKGLTQLRYEGKRVNNNLVRLLALYRINNAQHFANIAECNVYDVLEECMLENEGLLSIKGIQIELACDEDLFWFFDRNLVMGVINNVINNAYKYTKSKIRLSAILDNNQLKINIDDDGKGYPESMLNPDNEDGQQDIDYESGSTGLGIYFASIVADMHKRGDLKGHIRITNDGIDGGARFSFHIP